MKKIKMKKIGKILLEVAALAVYLNIGWALGAYYYDNIFHRNPSEFSLAQHIMAGGWDWFICGAADKYWELRIIYSIFWPLMLVATTLSWIVYSIYYFLWFTFAGGLAKILGLG